MAFVTEPDDLRSVPRTGGSLTLRAARRVSRSYTVRSREGVLKDMVSGHTHRVGRLAQSGSLVIIITLLPLFSAPRVTEDISVIQKGDISSVLRNQDQSRVQGIWDLTAWYVR